MMPHTRKMILVPFNPTRPDRKIEQLEAIDKEMQDIINNKNLSLNEKVSLYNKCLINYIEKDNDITRNNQLRPLQNNNDDLQIINKKLETSIKNNKEKETGDDNHDTEDESLDSSYLPQNKNSPQEKNNDAKFNFEKFAQSVKKQNQSDFNQFAHKIKNQNQSKLMEENAELKKIINDINQSNLYFDDDDFIEDANINKVSTPIYTRAYTKKNNFAPPFFNIPKSAKEKLESPYTFAKKLLNAHVNKGLNIIENSKEANNNNNLTNSINQSDNNLSYIAPLVNENFVTKRKSQSGRGGANNSRWIKYT
jgi:hypothetical protein